MVLLWLAIFSQSPPPKKKKKQIWSLLGSPSKEDHWHLLTFLIIEVIRFWFIWSFLAPHSLVLCIMGSCIGIILSCRWYFASRFGFSLLGIWIAFVLEVGVLTTDEHVLVSKVYIIIFERNSWFSSLCLHVKFWSLMILDLQLQTCLLFFLNLHFVVLGTFSW